LFSQKNFKLVADELPVAPALAELAGSPLWDAITLRQDIPGSPHKDTRCIAIRGPDLEAPGALDSLTSVDYAYADAGALPACHRLVESVTSPLPSTAVGRIFVVSLRAGGHITRHPDEGAYAEAHCRYHLCLSSKEGNTFHCGDESIHMLPGTLWTFNHQIEHEVFNDSPEERVHIIIDVRKEIIWQYQQS
jgi:Aspartyl/Asparaginyl beta-hydroxylase